MGAWNKSKAGITALVGLLMLVLSIVLMQQFDEWATILAGSFGIFFGAAMLLFGAADYYSRYFDENARY